MAEIPNLATTYMFPEQFLGGACPLTGIRYIPILNLINKGKKTLLQQVLGDSDSTKTSAQFVHYP